MPILRVHFRAADKHEGARASGRVVHCARHRLLAGTRRTGKEQRLDPRGLTRDAIAELTDSAAAAEQGALHAAACFAEERLCDAQFALERRGSLHDPRLQRCVGLLSASAACRRSA